MKFNKSIFWHRRDLRIEDNAGLFKALSNSTEVLPVFIFDRSILSKLPKRDRRVLFIHQEITKLKKQYHALGSDLLVLYGEPIELIPQLASTNSANAVFTNRDYEPYAIGRDKTIHETLQKTKIEFIGTKDHVVFEKNEVLKADGLPYTVYTPYSRKWKDYFKGHYISKYPSEDLVEKLTKRTEKQDLTELIEMGFENTTLAFPEKTVLKKTLSSYNEKRDFPSQEGTSLMGIHLRFGTRSIRSLVNESIGKSETYLNELIWRDFYQMILYHFPHSAENSFRKKYDLIEWEKNMTLFDLWCQGKTGYPIVDAGMRELNATGFMHNRVRMIVASFLTKHLLIDWRLGAAYFAEHLLDFELASNTGGWQWAAGCGCDAAPYFRIFNPYTQQQKFDKNFTYIKKWVPEFGTDEYTEAIVEHKFARERALSRYKKGLDKL
ncbi:MAG: deoxyribodipyrimidine photo-lyase [Crocinitomicaceae bacterium]